VKYLVDFRPIRSDCFTKPRICCQQFMDSTPMPWAFFTGSEDYGPVRNLRMWNTAQQEEQVGIAWFRPLKTKSTTTELVPPCAPSTPLSIYLFDPLFHSFSILALNHTIIVMRPLQTIRYPTSICNQVSSNTNDRFAHSLRHFLPASAAESAFTRHRVGNAHRSDPLQNALRCRLQLLWLFLPVQYLRCVL
jgi:hypothetical protein